MKAVLSKLLAVAVLAGTPVSLGAQVAPRPEDVGSLDGLIKGLYDVISGPAGQKRDWDRLRTLFAPNARLIPTGKGPDGVGRMMMLNVEEYIQRSGPFIEKDGFFERELGRTVEQYGNVVQAFSTYDSKRTLADPQPFMRGINSIQAFNDGKRWWIVNVFWESETPENPIPAKYLNKQ